jgi:hypothetical protein
MEGSLKESVDIIVTSNEDFNLILFLLKFCLNEPDELSSLLNAGVAATDEPFEASDWC